MPRPPQLEAAHPLDRVLRLPLSAWVSIDTDRRECGSCRRRRGDARRLV